MDEEQAKNIIPIRAFYSYAQEDEALCQELEKHLIVLSREGKLVIWSKRMLLPGADWADEVNQNLRTASLILLLISPDYLASEHCYSSEMQQALKRHENGTARVIPILLRPVNWQSTPFARLQYLPRNARSVTLWPDRDEALRIVAEEIQHLIEVPIPEENTSFSTHKPMSWSPPGDGKDPSQRLLYTYTAHAQALLTVDWSPDGTRIASGGCDETVHIWEAETGHHLLTYRAAKSILPMEVYIARWSPDSTRIALGKHNSSKVFVWDPLDGRNMVIYDNFALNPLALLMPRALWSLAWSPDGRYIASRNVTLGDTSVHIWDARYGNRIATISRPGLTGTLGLDFVSGIAWSPDGTRLAISWQKHLSVFHASTGKLQATYEDRKTSLTSIVWSRDSDHVIFVDEQKIVVWNCVTRSIVSCYVQHIASIEDLAVSPDGKYIASASDDRTVHVWEMMTSITRVIYKGHSDRVNAVTWSPDSTRIASAGVDCSVHVWRTLLDE